MSVNAHAAGRHAGRGACRKSRGEQENCCYFDHERAFSLSPRHGSIRGCCCRKAQEEELVGSCYISGERIDHVPGQEHAAVGRRRCWLAKIGAAPCASEVSGPRQLFVDRRFDIARRPPNWKAATQAHARPDKARVGVLSEAKRSPVYQDAPINEAGLAVARFRTRRQRPVLPATARRAASDIFVEFHHAWHL